MLTIALLGYFVANGANSWIIVVIVLLSLSLVIPANRIYKCPKCGHIDSIKVFKTLDKELPQNDKDTQ